MFTQYTSLEDKIDNYLFGDTDINHNSQEEYNTAYTELSVTLEQNNRLLDRVEFCMHSIEQSQSISQFLSDNALSLEKVPNWMSNAGKNVGEWFKKAWEFLKQGFLRMIKAIGGFFKKFAKIFKKKASIIRNGKKVKWNQRRADSMTVMTRINPKKREGGDSAFLTVYNKLTVNTQNLSEFSEAIVATVKDAPFKELITSDINNKTMKAFKEYVLKIQKETSGLRDSIPALQGRGAGFHFSLYGSDTPPAYEHAISDVFSEDDFANSLQYIDHLMDEIRSTTDTIEASLKKMINLFDNLVEFTNAVDKDKEDAEDVTQILKEYMVSTRKSILSVIKGMTTSMNDIIKVVSLCSTEALNLTVLIEWILDKMTPEEKNTDSDYDPEEPEYF